MAAMLNSLQMGFRTLAIQKRSSEVWKILGETKGEFMKFEKSLKAAQDNGFWGSEFDVHLTSDGVVVVNHDPVFHLTNVQTHTYSQLTRKGKLSNGETLPTLDQFNLQGINQFNVGHYYKEDLLHMNEEGYRRIGPV